MVLYYLYSKLIHLISVTLIRCLCFIYTFYAEVLVMSPMQKESVPEYDVLHVLWPINPLGIKTEALFIFKIDVQAYFRVNYTIMQHKIIKSVTF